ncbi:cation diffusion facilitator family transporter [Microbacterium sp. G2-8]|uniref:cation diffusion facilitator family transporter n=1 Tax=Microbacterium sp. G2-8 TaxID=2842454 RepID=UPI001C8A0A5D|nr:cation transporter [Microbacterium sp. G2-8]
MTGNGEPAAEADASSGRDALPDEQRRLLARAIRLEWITLGCLSVTIVLVATVAGQSQAMKTAWLEDLMSLLPPIAFLVATRRIGRSPDPEFPYGHHRSIGVAHLIAASALLAMGAFLIVDSASTLIAVERPAVGLTVLFGYGIWSGWLMIAVMAVTSIAPVILGRMKLKLARPLHDKVLFADAEMNKADWTTAVATIVGIVGIGIGIWWADSAAAILVSFSILRDGGKNMRAAIKGLTDARARTFDEKEPHPLLDEIEDAARAVSWVADARARVRDEGHVFHVEVFVIAIDGEQARAERCAALKTNLRAIDWKIHDVVIAPVRELPRFLRPHEG